MYITKMYDISVTILILLALMPSCFGNADPLSALWNRIEALERRDMEQSSKIDKLEQEVRLSRNKLTQFSELNENLQKDLAAKTIKLTEHEDFIAALQKDMAAKSKKLTEHEDFIAALQQDLAAKSMKLTEHEDFIAALQQDLAAKSMKLTEHEDFIAALQKDVEFQTSETDSNRRQVEILELKVQKLSLRLDETHATFVQPETNLEEINKIKAQLNRADENMDKSEDPNTLDSSTGYADHAGSSTLPLVDAASTESIESEPKSASENHDLAKNGIIETGSDLAGKLLGTITGNTLHTSVNGMLKNKQNGGHISKRFVANGVQTEPVAFHAVIAKRLVEHLGLDQNIVFETVNLNLGGGYHDQHGLFIAPKSGLYIFSISVLSYVNAKYEIYAALVKNGNILATAYGRGDSGRHDQGSVTLVTQLNVGDEISVKNIYRADDSLWGDKISSFMGLLVVEM